MKKFDLKIVTTDEAYAQAMSVRRRVFVEEYGIPADLEYDGNDHSATHILALNDGKPVGTIRIRYFGGFVKFERMCVLSDFRKTDLSEKIMQKAMLFSARKGYEKVYGVCKRELLSRWQRNGFEPIENVPSVHQNGMDLIPVCSRLPIVENPIGWQTSAEILNATEGAWPIPDSLLEDLRALKQRVHIWKTSTPDPKSLKNSRPDWDCFSRKGYSK